MRVLAALCTAMKCHDDNVSTRDGLRYKLLCAGNIVDGIVGAQITEGDKGNLLAIASDIFNVVGNRSHSGGANIFGSINIAGGRKISGMVVRESKHIKADIAQNFSHGHGRAKRVGIFSAHIFIGVRNIGESTFKIGKSNVGTLEIRLHAGEQGCTRIGRNTVSRIVGSRYGVANSFDAQEFCRPCFRGFFLSLHQRCSQKGNRQNNCHRPCDSSRSHGIPHSIL